MCMVGTSTREGNGPMTIQATAKRAGYTRFVIVEHGADDLYLWIKPNADLGDTFTGICDETGDVLNIKGWDVNVRDLED